MTSGTIGNRSGIAALSSWPLAASTAVLLTVFAAPARADESPFASVYTTELLPKGAVEMEQWLTWNTDKPHERFDLYQGRTELEYGFSEKFLGSLYLNYEWGRIDPYGPLAPDGRERISKFTGVNAEFIYQVLNPFTAPLGLAFYFEPGIGEDERSLEWKLLLQKNFLDDRLIFAGNINIEYVWAKDAGRWVHESALEFYLGGSYRVAPGWYLGAEFLNENGYAGHLFGRSQAEASAFYLGPAIHYANEHWWASLALYSQLPMAANQAHEPGAIEHGFLVGAERTRLRFRMGVAL